MTRLLSVFFVLQAEGTTGDLQQGQHGKKKCVQRTGGVAYEQRRGAQLVSPSRVTKCCCMGLRSEGKVDDMHADTSPVSCCTRRAGSNPGAGGVDGEKVVACRLSPLPDCCSRWCRGLCG